MTRTPKPYGVPGPYIPRGHTEVVLCSRKQMTRSWRIHNRKPKVRPGLLAALAGMFQRRPF